MSLKPLGAVVLLAAATAAACSPDPPSHDRAVEVVRAVCATETRVTTGLGIPTDVFALSEVADRAFEEAGRGIAELQAKGLAAMDDAPIERYLRGATGMNNALAELSRAADAEDVAAIDTAVVAATAAGDELDGAAVDLGIGPSCGSVAWRGDVLTHARTVSGLERDLMTPTGDLVGDLTTYCSRFDRSVGRAVPPADAEADRAYAYAVGAAAERFATRLAALDGTVSGEESDTLAALQEQVVALAELLAPSETLAIDGDTDDLDELTQDAAASVATILADLASTGAEC